VAYAGLAREVSPKVDGSQEGSCAIKQSRKERSQTARKEGVPHRLASYYGNIVSKMLDTGD